MSASKVVAVALGEVGYLEKKSNDYLDAKTANAGSGNYTKYARDLDAISGFYNGKKNGFPWCDVFFDWCVVQVYGVSGAKKVMNHGTCGAGCPFSADYYRAMGRFGTTPRVGAQIFFGTSGDETHTGIVYDFDNSYVYTVEGNTSSAAGVVANGGAVCKKRYARSYYKIVGYGYPNYDADSDAENTHTNTNTNTTTSANTAANAEKEGFEVAKTYRNGSTPETVYADTGKKKKIGSLNPWESCDCLGMADDMYIVRYKVDGTSTYKVGVVEYHGGCR